MKLVKQDIGLWVDIYDISCPFPKVGSYPIKFDSGDVINSDELNWPIAVATHWLKPIDQVYPLTEDELVTLVSDFFFKWYNGGGTNTVFAAKQFIQSLTKCK